MENRDVFARACNSHNVHIPGALVPQLNRDSRRTPADARPRKLHKFDILVRNLLLV